MKTRKQLKNEFLDKIVERKLAFNMKVTNAKIIDTVLYNRNINIREGDVVEHRPTKARGKVTRIKGNTCFVHWSGNVLFPDWHHSFLRKIETL